MSLENLSPAASASALHLSFPSPFLPTAHTGFPRSAQGLGSRTCTQGEPKLLLIYSTADGTDDSPCQQLSSFPHFLVWQSKCPGCFFPSLESLPFEHEADHMV